MYTLNNLSKYYFDGSNILDASTGEILQPVNNEYILSTDETLQLPKTGKTINLVRRFKMEHLNKLMQQSGTPVNLEVEHPQNGTLLSPENGTPSKTYSINGTPYSSLREASKESGTPLATLKRWFDTGKQGYQIV